VAYTIGVLSYYISNFFFFFSDFKLTWEIGFVCDKFDKLGEKKKLEFDKTENTLAFAIDSV
jgi:hypothetical protein